MDTTESECPKAYFRRNEFYPFIDHTVAHSRFIRGMFLGFTLLPNYMIDLTRDDKDAITTFFSPDLPNEKSLIQN